MQNITPAQFAQMLTNINACKRAREWAAGKNWQCRQHKDIGGFDMRDGNINVFVEQIKNHIQRYAKTV